jgi:hypothetical protein
LRKLGSQFLRFLWLLGKFFLLTIGSICQLSLGEEELG